MPVMIFNGMRARLLVFLGAMLASSFAPAAQGSFAERDVFVPMRDGVRLQADVFRPEKTGRFPTLVYRTPYDRGRSRENAVVRGAVARGYAVVLQDVRGR